MTRLRAARPLKRRVQELLRRRGIEVTRFRSGSRALEGHLLEMRSPAVVFDVGANIGQFALGLRALGYDGPLWSFEPEPRACASLRSRASADQDWHVVPAALGRAPGTADLHVSANSVSSSLLPMVERHVRADPASRTLSTITVPVATLDDWRRDNGASGRCWLKIDTQGYEADVLAGARSTLTDVDLLRVELSLVPLYAGQPDYGEVLTDLRTRGFVLAHLDPGFEDHRTHQLLQVDACLVSAEVAARLAGVQD